MWHNDYMISQVLVRPPKNGEVALGVYPRDVAEMPDNDLGKKPHLGSQDLIRLAGFAAESGLIVTGFSVDDAYLNPLEQGENYEISDAMKLILDRYGVESLLSAMREDFRDLYVTSVKLIHPETGLRMDIRRRGVIDSSQNDEAQGLLTSAWKELKLT